jgi:Protein of unknown function (DUF2878)
MRNLLIIIIFQIGWFACVFAGANTVELPIALAVALTLLACNLWLKREELIRELRLVATVTLVGFVIETINLATGVFKLTGSATYPWLCPVWFLLLWALFATLLRGPFGWMSGRYWLSALLGAIFAAPNYFAGARLGAVTFNENLFFSFGMLAIIWALAMPFMVWLARK